MDANLLWHNLRFGDGIEALIDGEYDKLADMVIWYIFFWGSEVIKRSRIFWHCPSTFGKYVGFFTSCVKLLFSTKSLIYKPSREV